MMSDKPASEHEIETYKSLVQISNEGYKLLLAINGGGMLALLTFAGQMIINEKDISCFALSFYYFTGGIVGCALAMFSGYQTQLSVFNNKKPLAQRWLNIATVLFLTSILMFCIGCVVAANIFQTMQSL